MTKPPRIDSGYSLAQKYRVSEQTAKETLRTNGYKYEEVSPGDKAWIRYSTQLDDIEAMLQAVYNMLASPTGLSEAISEGRLSTRSGNGRGNGLPPESWNAQGVKQAEVDEAS